jgi:hypothetical protein
VPGWLERLARFGLACRGVVYLAVASLALEVARGQPAPEAEADQRGVLVRVAHQHLRWRSSAISASSR